MSRLDEELARAADAGEDEGAPSTTTPAVLTATPAGARSDAADDTPPPRRSYGLLITLLVMGTSLVVLMLTSFRSAVVYSKGVDELFAERARLTGRAVRVEGTLVKGTLVRREDPCEYRFFMERGGQRLEVDYPHCSIPDTFRDVSYTDVSVTAEGRLGQDGRFAATQIMAKCPSKYEEQAASAGSAAARAAMPAARTAVD
jgi:cytochrome c-type biogenesis protein CcmE